jgi:hypothetical protein
MALLRAAGLRGVLALGLPKISSLVEGIFIPTFSLFSAVVDQCKQRDSLGSGIFLSICTVCSTFIALLLFRCAGRGAAT